MNEAEAAHFSTLKTLDIDIHQVQYLQQLRPHLRVVRESLRRGQFSLWLGRFPLVALRFYVERLRFYAPFAVGLAAPMLLSGNFEYTDQVAQGSDEVGAQNDRPWRKLIGGNYICGLNYTA